MKRTATTTGFLFFIFDLEYLIRVQSSELLHVKINPTSYTCLDHDLHELKLQSFPSNKATKMRERHQLFFGLRLVSKEFQHLTIQTKIVKHIGRFFHQIKVLQPIGRQDSVQTVIRTSRRLDSFLHDQRLRTLKSFQLFKSEVKKTKNL